MKPKYSLDKKQGLRFEMKLPKAYSWYDDQLARGLDPAESEKAPAAIRGGACPEPRRRGAPRLPVSWPPRRSPAAYWRSRSPIEKKLILGLAALIITPAIMATSIMNTKFGIGEATPVSKLEVKGDGATSTTSAANVKNSANTSLLFVRDDGNVGINTAVPLEKLDVRNGAIRVGYDTDTFDQLIEFWRNSFGQQRCTNR